MVASKPMPPSYMHMQNQIHENAIAAATLHRSATCPVGIVAPAPGATIPSGLSLAEIRQLVLDLLG